MIFISYRRDDTQDIVDRMCEKLREVYGRERVERDIDTFPLGKDWHEHVRERIGSSQVVLVVIGDRWLDIEDSSGKRRLDSLNDPVRLELETALGEGIPTIPILTRDADFPSAEELPGSLAQLASKAGERVRPDPDFPHDMVRLICKLRGLVKPDVVQTTPLGAGFDRTFVEAARASFQRVVTEEYLPRDAQPSDLSDPRSIYIGLKCVSHHDGDGPPTDAVKWLLEGIDDG